MVPVIGDAGFTTSPADAAAWLMPAKLPAAIVFVNVAGDAPALVAVTLTLIVQVAAPDVAGAAPSAPPLRSTLPPPGFAVSVPPHVVLAADGLATIIPAGNVSVSAMLPSAVALKLLIVREIGRAHV